MVALGVTREVKDREDEVGEEVDRLVSLVPVRARANRLKPKRRKCGVLCVGEGVEGERPEGKKKEKRRVEYSGFKAGCRFFKEAYIKIK